MIGYTPAEQAIRATLDQPPDTGADQPPAWHDQPGDWGQSYGETPAAREYGFTELDMP